MKKKILTAVGILLVLSVIAGLYFAGPVIKSFFNAVMQWCVANSMYIGIAGGVLALIVLMVRFRTVRVVGGVLLLLGAGWILIPICSDLFGGEHRGVGVFFLVAAGASLWIANEIGKSSWGAGYRSTGEGTFLFLALYSFSLAIAIGIGAQCMDHALVWACLCIPVVGLVYYRGSVGGLLTRLPWLWIGGGVAVWLAFSDHGLGIWSWLTGPWSIRWILMIVSIVLWGFSKGSRSKGGMLLGGILFLISLWLIFGYKW